VAAAELSCDTDLWAVVSSDSRGAGASGSEAAPFGQKFEQPPPTAAAALKMASLTILLTFLFFFGGLLRDLPDGPRSASWSRGDGFELAEEPRLGLVPKIEFSSAAAGSIAPTPPTKFEGAEVLVGAPSFSDILMADTSWLDTSSPGWFDSEEGPPADEYSLSLGPLGPR